MNICKMDLFVLFQPPRIFPCSAMLGRVIERPRGNKDSLTSNLAAFFTETKNLVSLN